MGGALSDMMIKPHQSPLFDDPKNYKLPYEDVEFKTSDGATLRGWLIKGNTDKVIIQTHFGVQCNRAGYDPKGKGLITLVKEPIRFLRQAKYLYDKGYSVLMYDMRGHGSSDVGPVPWVSWGRNEAKDVVGAVDYIQSRPEYRDAKIGLLSICMGLSATTFAFAEKDGLATRKNIKAIVGVQPLTYKPFVDAFGLPSCLENMGAKKTQKRLGIDLREETFIPLAKHVTVPTLVIQNKNDPWTKKRVVDDYYNGLKVEKAMKWLDLEKNRAAAYDYLGKHPENVFRWFDDHM